MAKGTRYSDDFKKQIVRLYDQVNKSVSYRVNTRYAHRRFISGLTNQKTTGSFKTNDNLTDEQRELNASRKRIDELEMENDILKQAALIVGVSPNHKPQQI